LKILVTGATGFLGSALAAHLQGRGHHLAVLVRATSELRRLGARWSNFELGRCANDGEVTAFVRQVAPDVVIHTACCYGRRGESELQISDSNVRFGLVVLDALLKCERQFAFINTGTVLNPGSNSYALSKHQFMQWAQEIRARHADRMQLTNVLLQHMYGPGDDETKFPTHIVRACLRNDAVIKLTPGEQTRDFVYIDDVVMGYEVLLCNLHRLESMEEIELGSGIAVRLRDFVETAHTLTASRSQLCFGAVPYRAGEPMHCQADTARLRALGWSPAYDLRTGLIKMIERGS
jgi:CDP-paratose synthetase